MEYLEHCYLLHARPYGETSLLIRLMHRDTGVMGAIAKGGAKKSVLQPFFPFSANISGRGELKTLFSPELSGAPVLLGYSASLCALYVHELILVSCAEYDPHPVVFDAYLALLGRLAGKGDESTALRRFEQILLKDIGYQLNYHHARDGKAVTASQRYNLDDDWVFTINPRGQYSGASLLAIAADDYSLSQTRTDARILCRELISRIVGRKLNSWKLFG